MHSSCDLGIRYFTPLGGIGVSLFLILSGYGLSESFKRKGVDSFWKNKISKIWIPYLIVLLVLSILKFPDINWQNLLLEIIGINSRFWFISFLLYNYLIFYVCCKSSEIYKYRYVLFGAFAVCIFLFDNRIRGEQSLSFVSGIILSDYKDRIINVFVNSKKLQFFQTISLLLSIAALAAKQTSIVRLNMEQYRIFQNSIELMVKFPFALFLLSLCFLKGSEMVTWKHIVDKNRFLMFCATISLELYMIHFSLRFMIDKDNPITSLICFLVLSFGTSWLLYKIKNLISSSIWKK